MPQFNKSGLILFSSIMLLFIVEIRSAKSDTYQWVDNEGTTHFTDNPQELPEPYRTKAVNELIEKQKQNQKKPNPRSPKDSTPLPDVSNERLPVDSNHPPPAISTESSTGSNSSRSHVDSNDKKKFWQEKVRNARKRVAELSSQCENLKLEMANATNARAIYGRPSDLAWTEKVDSDLERCNQDLEQARRYLDEGLPEEARRAGALPGWLR